jgi:hypothetical protein
MNGRIVSCLLVILLINSFILISSKKILAATPQQIITNTEKSIIKIDRIGSEISKGTGVIIEREGNSSEKQYTVLTCWHNVKIPGNYTIQINKDDYTIDSINIKRVKDLDLAEIKFKSNKIYEAAKFEDSNSLKKGSKIYLAAWMNPTENVIERRFITPEGKIILINQKDPKNEGYTLLYSLETVQSGTSGGAILNEEGFIVAINGELDSSNTGTSGFVAGIPINFYFKAKGKVISFHNRETRKKSSVLENSSLDLGIRMYETRLEIQQNLIKLEDKINFLKSIHTRVILSSTEEKKIKFREKARSLLADVNQEYEEIQANLTALKTFAYNNPNTNVANEKFYNSILDFISDTGVSLSKTKGDLDQLSFNLSLEGIP